MKKRRKSDEKATEKQAIKVSDKKQATKTSDNIQKIRSFLEKNEEVKTSEMTFMSRVVDLVTKCGAVVISPAYRLSIQESYPAAIKDSYRALMYVKNNTDE
jgi:hypothetical protein